MNKLILALLFTATLAQAEVTAEGWYAMGTKDGCSSGNQIFTKDIKAYVEQPYYKAGYDDGFTECKRKQDYKDSIVNDAVNAAFYGRRGWW